jgi:chromosome segregation ATPase
MRFVSWRATDEELEEERRQHAEEFQRRSARIDASAASKRSEIGVLKAQVAGLLEELAFARHRIDILEDSATRRLDRLDDRVDALARPTESEGASSTGATVS